MSVQPFMPGFEGEAARVPDAERQKALSQWYTDPELAERTWRWMVRAHSAQRVSVLEPSCGRGALIRPLFTLDVPVRRLVAYDIDSDNAATVAAMLAPTGLDFEVRALDFLRDIRDDDERFDVCVMNPPYEDNADIAFAERALERCTWVAGIFAARMLFSETRAAFWRWTDIRRAAILSKRPKFGGGFSPMTDFAVLELARRATARKQGEASTTATEWW